jgi:hypothetical protein
MATAACVLLLLAGREIFLFDLMPTSVSRVAYTCKQQYLKFLRVRHSGLSGSFLSLLQGGPAGCGRQEQDKLQHFWDYGNTKQTANGCQ